MIRNIEFHHAAPEACEPLRLRVNDHAFADRGRARGRRPWTARDLHKTKTARSEGVQHVRRTKLWNMGAPNCRSPQDGRVFGDGDSFTVDGQRNRLLRARGRRAVVSLGYHCHDPILELRWNPCETEIFRKMI